MANLNTQDRLLFWLRATGSIPNDAREVPVDTLVANYSRLKQDSFAISVNTGSGVDLSKFNPLSKVSAGNPWASQYENQNRMNEIKLDVDRTHQEVKLFQTEEVQKSLMNILFVFGKVHSLPYRQGMNEIGAIIFSVVSEGYEPSTDERDIKSAEVRESIGYTIFSSLMMNIGIVDFFFSKSVQHEKPISNSAPSPLLSRCEKIFDLLSQKDARLHKHLVMNDIAPNLFLLRWVRILFSREFSIANTVRIWDFLFAQILPGEPASFPSTIDYFAIAMVLNIRQSLLSSDNSGCFSLLLKYPSVDHVGQLLDLTVRVKQGSLVVASAPPILNMQASSKRDMVLSDLAAVIADLRNSQVAKSIEREISKLEHVVGYLKAPSGR